MATIKKYNGSTWENTTARKYETKSEIITPPTTIYADGTAITSYTIKGNTVQGGTPTPSNPVDVVGVGTLDSGQYKIPILSNQQTTNIYLGSTQTVRAIKKLVLTGEEPNWGTYTLKDSRYCAYLPIPNFKGEATTRKPAELICSHYVISSQISIYDGVNQTCIGSRTNRGIIIVDINISNETEFKAYLAQQYANGTPVTVWFVLATAETATVNEPLMKIGDYADALSNATAIPTTEGANSITVDTTVQPSEFSATWTGWHNANVKEWDGSDWQ